MKAEDFTKTSLFINRDRPYTIETYPRGQPFERLGLTLSVKGWTASVQWKGTTGFRGTGKTQEEALKNVVVGIVKKYSTRALYLPTETNL